MLWRSYFVTLVWSFSTGSGSSVSPSHHIKQCSTFTKKTFSNTLSSSFHRNLYNSFEVMLIKMSPAKFELLCPGENNLGTAPYTYYCLPANVSPIYFSTSAAFSSCSSVGFWNQPCFQWSMWYPISSRINNIQAFSLMFIFPFWHYIFTKNNSIR